MSQRKMHMHPQELKYEKNRARHRRELVDYIHLFAKGLAETEGVDFQKNMTAYYEKVSKSIFDDSDAYLLKDKETEVLGWTMLDQEVITKQKQDRLLDRTEAIEEVIEDHLDHIVNQQIEAVSEKKASPRQTKSLHSNISSCSSSSSSTNTQTLSPPVVSSDVELSPPPTLLRTRLISGEYHLKDFSGETQVNYFASLATGTQTPKWDHEDHSTVTIKSAGENAKELKIKAHPKKAGAPKVGVQETYELSLLIKQEEDNLVISHVKSINAIAKLPLGSMSLSGYELQGQKIPINLKHDEKHQGHIHLDSTIHLNQLNISSVLRKTFGMFSNPIQLKAKLVKKDTSESQNSDKAPSHGKKQVK